MFGCGGSAEDFDDDLSWLRYSPAWTADVLPLDEPWRKAQPRRAMLVVMGEGSVVHEELLAASAVADPGDAARLLGAAVHAVAAKAGGYPRRLLVGEWSYATLLSSELSPRGVDVRVSALRKTRRTIHRLASLLDEPELARDLDPVSHWSEVDGAALDDYFRAAARLWHARPWDVAEDEEVLLASRAGRESAVVLTHPRAHGQVVTVFTCAADYPDAYGSRDPVWGVRFARPRDVPRLFGGELPTPGSAPVPEPYPFLLEGFGSSSPSSAELHELAAVLDAVAALAEAGVQVRTGLAFTHPSTGVALRLESDARYLRWPMVKKVRLGCAAGEGAHPAAALVPLAGFAKGEGRRVERFATGLDARRPRAWTTARQIHHAREWTRFLLTEASVPATAVTELDLRTFLYAWYPRVTREEETSARAVPASLSRYFRFLEEHEHIRYPWAAAVLRERELYVDRLETAPLHELGDEVEEWLAPFHADLDARVMLPGRSFPGVHVGYDAPASPRVAALSRELLRRWQLWRDEEILNRVVDPAALRGRLAARQREWERAPHGGAHGKSPLRMVAEAEQDAAGVS
jgi:hypothetical protein